MKRLLLSVLFAAVPAFAGPYDQVYSIITIDRAPATDPNLRPVIVNRVDGETVMSTNEAVVAPGVRSCGDCAVRGHRPIISARR